MDLQTLGVPYRVVVVDKPHIIRSVDKTSDKLVIGGNNTKLVRMTTPLSGVSSYTTSLSGARARTNQSIVTVEMGIIWKPLIVDD